MSRNQSEDKQKVLDQLHKTPVIQVACERCGVPRATYYRWRKDDEEFAAKCDAAIEESTGFINDMAESQLIAAIKEKNMTAIIYWLKSNHSKYATKIQVSGQIDHKLEALTPEQAEIVGQALRLSGLISTSEETDG